MLIRAILPHLGAVLTAANLDDPAGVQLVDAAHVAAMHHPPLNPDLPALLATNAETDLDALQRVLLNQYPPEHTLQVVRSTATGITAEALQLGALAEIAAPAAETWQVIVVAPLPEASSFARFQETIAHLRAPEGCPWDRKQTHQSLRPYLLEETYEVLDALDAGDMDLLIEELGDLLLQIVLHSQIAVGAGTFRMADIIAHVNAKIIHRHPHVWGDVIAEDDEAVKVNWDQIKQAEKQQNEGRASRLDGVPKALPALSQALSYQDRAARVRFDWPVIEPVIAKIHEEIAEVHTAEDATSREQEIGDLLFAVVNWARWLGVEPESALRGTNARFYRRFHYIEQHVQTQGREWDDLTLDEMDALWEEAKTHGL
jgi:tetrapyrrole methylase family protein / MazG family protein